EDGIRDFHVTGVQTCALPIFVSSSTRNFKISKLFPRTHPSLSDSTSGTSPQESLGSPRWKCLRALWSSQFHRLFGVSATETFRKIGRASCREGLCISEGDEAV